MNLHCAPAGSWPWFVNASPFLVKALGDAPLCDVWSEYKRGHAQLWVAIDDAGKWRAACVTLSMRDTLDFWLCAGSGCDWRDLGNRIAALAKGHFKRLTISGRKGWARLLGFTRNDEGEWERAL